MTTPVASPLDDEIARRALAEYDGMQRAQVRMINLSENATYMVESQEQCVGVLRVHRENYHDAAAVRSELSWLDALREEAGVSTPRVLPASDGRRVVSVGVNGVDRHVVLFERMPGLEPDDSALRAEDFRVLGSITARLHGHARTWTVPDGFTRFSWDWSHTLGDQPRWGRWEDGIGIGPTETDLLSHLVRRLHERLTAYGTSPERFGLVHGDLRPANLLLDHGRVNVIDFDDCGFSWFLYDFGAAVSFVEDHPRLPAWQAAWLAGYREVSPLPADDEQMLATFVMLRRMLLVAWMGTHSHAREVQLIGPSYAVGTCALAERYLASDGLSL